MLGLQAMPPPVLSEGWVPVLVLTQKALYWLYYSRCFWTQSRSDGAKAHSALFSSVLSQPSMDVDAKPLCYIPSKKGE